MVPAEPGKPPYVPTNWVTVSAVFDHKRANRFTEAYLRRFARIHRHGLPGDPAPRHAERRNVVGFRLGRRGRMAYGGNAETPELTPDGIAELTDVDKRALEKFREFLQQGPNQVAVVRPRMADVVNGTRWSPPSLVPYRDLLLMDDQYFHPDDPPAAEPEDRYGFGAPNPRPRRPQARRHRPPSSRRSNGC